MKLIAAVLAVGTVLVGAVNASAAEKDSRDVLTFTMKNLKGEDVDLSDYHGKVVMIVNVASKCGLTPQYKQLQAMHEKYSDQGLAVLGFPANEFGKQEPGTDLEISNFCTENYGVEFDMFSKVVVTGKGQCELYQVLTNNDEEPIRWNFEKFIVDKNGKVVARFEPRTKPDAKEVIEVVEKQLAE